MLISCCFLQVLVFIWPQDYRDIDALSYDISKVPEKVIGSRPGGKHLRHGCTCHFSVHISKKTPERALITYVEMNHIDITGKPCHGQEVDDFVGRRAYHAPHVSNELYQWVERCLLLGISPECVHHKHSELVHNKVTSSRAEFNQNDFLTRDDIRNIEMRLKHAQYMLDNNDAQSVRRWQATNPDKVFYYSEFDNSIDDEGHTPFISGIQQPLQLEWMRKYGHDSILATDSTFGTNHFKVYLYCYIYHLLFIR